MNAPSRFFPLSNGLYEVSAGLRPLGADFGNGPADRRVFLIDDQFQKYREGKLAARAERLSAYYPEAVGFSAELESAVVRFIAEKVAAEYPEHFTLESNASGFELSAKLTGEQLSFSADGRLMNARSQARPAYIDGFDALASQLQEDLAIWTREPQSNREWLARIHLCFPNHWAAEDKIGRAFNDVHAPVAGFGRLAKAAPSLVDGMLTKGPFIRFAWGVATDTVLNHHPRGAFQGRQFNPEKPELYLRIERQTLHPFPQQHGSLFTIRTFFLNCEKDLSPQEREKLRSAIESMSPESLVYKGLSESRNAILGWLSALPV